MKTAALLFVCLSFHASSRGATTSWKNDISATSGDPGPRDAGSVLDQHQETESGGSFFYANLSLAQTFVPSVSGQLSQVDLYADSFTFTGALPAQVSIVTTVGGAPSGSVLGSVTDAWATFGWHSINLASQNIVLQAGQTYGIVVANNDPDFNTAPTDGLEIEWYANAYANGSLWTKSAANDWVAFHPDIPNNTSDMMFRTWMAAAVPEPAMLSLMLVAAPLFARQRRATRDGYTARRSCSSC